MFFSVLVFFSSCLFDFADPICFVSQSHKEHISFLFYIIQWIAQNNWQEKNEPVVKLEQTELKLHKLKFRTVFRELKHSTIFFYSHENKSFKTEKWMKINTAKDFSLLQLKKFRWFLTFENTKTAMKFACSSVANKFLFI